MPALRTALLVTLFSVAASAPFQAQQPTPTVPRLVPVAGVYAPADGRPPAPVETVTLSIYAEQTGGSPIWEEVQNAPVDASGRYSLLLGASLADGVPLDMFTSGDARWLGVRFSRAGEVEGPRTRLASAPYALRAADAETLGGRPASAYLLAPEAGGSDARAHLAGSASSAEVAPTAILNGQTNSLAKYQNNADTIGASAIFESTGSVGIGTGAAIGVGGPVDRLNVRFNNTAGTITGISIRNDGTTASSFSGVLFYDQAGALAQFQGFNNVTHEYRINNIAQTTPGIFDGSINFMIGSKSRFLVASNGNIGVGTATPSTTMEVVSEAAGTDFLKFTKFGNDPPRLDMRRARGTVAAPAAVQAGDVLLSLGAAGAMTTGPLVFARPASIDIVAAGDFSNGVFPASMRFSTTDAGLTPAERMRITEAGNVGINTTTPATRLQVLGDIRVGTNTIFGCVQRFDAGVIAGTCSSDRRFKRDITPFGSVLPAVAALRPVHYYWRTSEFPERHFGDGQAYGLIAQEVETVLPELVVTDPDGFKAVDYSKLPLLTVQAIVELKTENDALQARVAELERLVKQLLADRSR